MAAQLSQPTLPLSQNISNFCVHKTETNASPITTNEVGNATFNSSLRLVKSAVIQIPGYITVVTGVSGNTISFQLYTGASTSNLTMAPNVTISAGSLLVDEWGY